MASAVFHASPPRTSTSLSWPFQPAFLPIWWAWLLVSWWGETAHQLAALPPGMIDGQAPAVPLVLGGRAFGWFTEAALYALWWRSRGTPLPYWRFATWVASLSIIDLFAFVIRRAAADTSAIGRGAVVLLAGPGSLDPTIESGSAAAFGTVGLLVLLRVAMTAWATAQGTGRPYTRALLVTGGAWLATRLVMLWSYDLLRGVSPVR